MAYYGDAVSASLDYNLSRGSYNTCTSARIDCRVTYIYEKQIGIYLTTEKIYKVLREMQNRTY